MGMVLAATLIAGSNIACPSMNPCIDGVQGDRVNDESAIPVTLINDTTDFVHFIGSRESRDVCNRVRDRGGSRIIFVPGDRVAFSVRAISGGVLLHQITCALPEEATVRFTDQGLVCVAGSG